MSDWDPELYNRFVHARKRPFSDLLDLLPPRIVGRMLDLGCGDGANTLLAAERLGMDEVVGVDHSPAMLERARAADDRPTWVEGDLREGLAAWGPARVVLSNAALQFVDDHAQVVPQMTGAVAPGGWLAVHIPFNHQAPTHLLLAETARGFPEHLGDFVQRWPQKSPEAYGEMLRAAGFRFISAQERTYRAPLAGIDEIVRWIRGGAARPYLARLPESLHQAFLDAYRERVDAAYPPCDHADTRLLDYRRVLFVGQRPE